MGDELEALAGLVWGGHSCPPPLILLLSAGPEITDGCPMSRRLCETWDSTFLPVMLSEVVVRNANDNAVEAPHTLMQRENPERHSLDAVELRMPDVSPPLRGVGFHILARCHAERSCRSQRERQRGRSTPYQHVARPTWRGMDFEVRLTAES